MQTLIIVVSAVVLLWVVGTLWNILVEITATLRDILSELRGIAAQISLIRQKGVGAGLEEGMDF